MATRASTRPPAEPSEPNHARKDNDDRRRGNANPSPGPHNTSSSPPWPMLRMLLRELVGPERNCPARRSCPATRLRLRGCSSEGRGTFLAEVQASLGRCSDSEVEHQLPMQARQGPPSATVALLARSTSLMKATPHTCLRARAGIPRQRAPAWLRMSVGGQGVALAPVAAFRAEQRPRRTVPGGCRSGIAATRCDGSSVAASRPIGATSRPRVRRRSAVETDWVGAGASPAPTQSRAVRQLLRPDPGGGASREWHRPGEELAETRSRHDYAGSEAARRS